MKKTRLYIFTFTGISLIVLLVGIGMFRYFYNSAKEALWNSKMESGRRETREVGRMLEQQLQNGIPPQKVIDNLQQSILNTDVQSEFLCMYNMQGIELCHPNPSLVGQKIDAANSSFAGKEGVVDFSNILRSGTADAGIRSFPAEKQRSAEIVTVYPVKGSDWMVAAHANIAVLQVQLDNLYQRFMIGVLLMVIIISASCYGLIRMIYRKYEGRMEQEIGRLNEEVNNLTMLNRQLELSQERQREQEKETITANTNATENSRKRLLTYVRDEMAMVEVRDIAFIYLSQNNVFVQTFLNQQYSLNISLDELAKQLDNDVFYRANRQFIVNVNAIKTILVYGRNQLQLITHPMPPEDIIISKNKVAEFKKWLDR
ncbi:MAG: LytTR family transcriptional regulator DNA-binding domain-containing protein [Niastella sp.]|nr:LytTR family transcriptional regulator DNA-binding domain-containing protein [Niastella sp.]